MIVGHRQAVTTLSADLPPVTLLSGPAGVGKKALAEHLVNVHGVGPADAVTVEHLDIGAARRLVDYFAVAPIAGRKIALVDLDGASEAALNCLLKTLEEMPPTCHMILWRSGRTLLTVESRAHVVRLGLLTDTEVAQVLTDVLGVPAAQASEWAQNAGGRVQRALEWQETSGAKSSALNLLRAVATADADLFENAMLAADARTVQMLRRWATEVRTRRLRTFTPADGCGMGAVEAERILRGLASPARPRLVLRATLSPLIEQRRTS